MTDLNERWRSYPEQEDVGLVADVITSGTISATSLKVSPCVSVNWSQANESVEGILPWKVQPKIKPNETYILQHRKLLDSGGAIVGELA